MTQSPLSVPAMMTIAIPYYSNREYLRRAIESVFAQTDSRWTLLISEDPGPEPLAADDPQLRDPRVKYIRAEERLGLVRNFNKCLELSETSLVTLLHADDELEPDYVKRMISLGESWPDVGMFYCQVTVIGSEGTPVFSFKDWVKRFFDPARRKPAILSGEEGLLRLLKANFIFCPSLCFQMSRIPGLHFSTEWNQVTDLDLVTRALVSGVTILGVPEPLFRYRRHKASVTEKGDSLGNRFAEEVSFFNYFYQMAVRKQWPRVSALLRRRTVLRCHILFSVINDLLAGRVGVALKKFRLL